ncbi:bifunctional nuclease family protein [Lishizhenia sp.]|uniref:bifunctional nuclease family protein n=1 Tax=Lishizhenia sp. TaxID=2497594 RepID=UPI00299EF2F4|nr:bifunctional nuclease family protein [Lishizhenia sp.]MDX1445075.1 bifunctional nuclease family protein [Lishizhenia sp.]
MEKVKLEIVGLSYSQTQSGAYALVLSEVNGKRRLPIIIGGFEAQAIAIELEKMTPTRPLTHDLFKNFALAYDINIKEIVIYNLVEGIFYSKLICEKEGVITEIDARTSDAIALGVRFNCPVFTFESILSSAGVQLDDPDGDGDAFAMSDMDDEDKEVEEKDEIKSLSLSDLEQKLNEAIEKEDYELASKLRDEINKRTS